MDLESHGMAVSPDGGLSNGAVVVVAMTVVVVAITGAGVVSVTASEDDEHAATINAERRTHTARFTHCNVSAVSLR